MKDWCSRCTACAKRKPNNRRSKARLQQYLVGCPLERVAMGILGPLPETDDKIKYILIVGDYFTKWTEAFAIKDQSAETVASTFVKEFVSLWRSKANSYRPGQDI